MPNSNIKNYRLRNIFVNCKLRERKSNIRRNSKSAASHWSTCRKYNERNVRSTQDPKEVSLSERERVREREREERDLECVGVGEVNAAASDEGAVEVE